VGFVAFPLVISLFLEWRADVLIVPERVCFPCSDAVLLIVSFRWFSFGCWRAEVKETEVCLEGAAAGSLKPGKAGVRCFEIGAAGSWVLFVRQGLRLFLFYGGINVVRWILWNSGSL
jgi:hypothetical protein